MKSVDYPAIVENARDGIIIIQDGKLRFANPAAVKLSGYILKEKIGKSFLELVAPEHRKTIGKRYAERMAGKKVPYLSEIAILRKDGTIVPVEVNSTVIDYEGRPADLVIVRDITESKKAEEKLENAAREWKETFDSISDFVSVHGRDFRFLALNRTLIDFLGKKPEELIGKHCYEVIHGTKKPWPSCPHAQMLKSKTAVTAEVDDPKVGCPLLVTASPILDDKGRVAATVHIARDITERKKAEKELRESEERARIMWDYTRAAIMVVDVETHKIVDVNRLAVEMIGAPKERIVGHACRKYVCPAEVGKCPVTDLRQKVDSSERVLVTADGKNVPILKTVTSVMLKGRKHLIESFIDISEQKKANEELEKRVEELERFHRMVVGRELRMAELKKRIKELEEEKKAAGRP